MLVEISCCCCFGVFKFSPHFCQLEPFQLYTFLSNERKVTFIHSPNSAPNSFISCNALIYQVLQTLCNRMPLLAQCNFTHAFLPPPPLTTFSLYLFLAGYSSPLFEYPVQCASNSSVITENWKQYQVKDGCYCFWCIRDRQQCFLSHAWVFVKVFHLGTCYLWYVTWWWSGAYACRSFVQSVVQLVGGSLSFLNHVSNSSQTIQRQFATAWTSVKWNHVNLITRHFVSISLTHRKTLELFSLFVHFISLFPFSAFSISHIYN